MSWDLNLDTLLDGNVDFVIGNIFIFTHKIGLYCIFETFCVIFQNEIVMKEKSECLDILNDNEDVVLLLGI